MDTQDTPETTPPDQTEFSIRAFLREREALLVHFSTLMSNHPHLLFPEDLRQAAGLAGVPLSFSTIMAGDVGPYQDPDIDPADANAGGSIGIIVDIHSNDCVVTVGPNDDGTSVNPTTGEFISGGYPPTPERCAWSIDGRKTSNEWFVRDYRPIGIFAYGPILVRGQSGGEGEVPRDAAFACFPQFRIFSARGGQFIEFDSETKKWNPVSYDTIMNATVRPAE
ncbi:hypothetical protein [Bradyrhizobium diazoefficiens]|uniref:hypothetical protein n=1 Tax=Bradyrhizobium diazoefficiens TaxID=1355477 RepID=UPI00272D8BDE|nr:hypothetical protein [Bradyrhizobium diazoefficiens]WLA63799.1 hypothetical protein QNN01_36400 [Bradyrhizobium diazoefficiens]